MRANNRRCKSRADPDIMAKAAREAGVYSKPDQPSYIPAWLGLAIAALLLAGGCVVWWLIIIIMDMAR